MVRTSHACGMSWLFDFPSFFYAPPSRPKTLRTFFVFFSSFGVAPARKSLCLSSHFGNLEIGDVVFIRASFFVSLLASGPPFCGLGCRRTFMFFGFSFLFPHREIVFFVGAPFQSFMTMSVSSPFLRGGTAVVAEWACFGSYFSCSTLAAGVVRTRFSCGSPSRPLLGHTPSFFSSFDDFFFLCGVRILFRLSDAFVRRRRPKPF